MVVNFQGERRREASVTTNFETISNGNSESKPATLIKQIQCCYTLEDGNVSTL
jgi:hypothetical protein